MRLNNVSTVDPDAYCDHSALAHDGQTLYLLLDAGNDVKLYRWNWYKPAAVWEQLWSLRAAFPAIQWPTDRKPGLGHDLLFGPSSLIMSVPFKVDGSNPAIGGTTVISYARDSIPPMVP